MPSILPNYEYDIFISYRQKDNLSSTGGGWVTEFVNALKNELEATFKEPISVYFDENPHDGLHDTHDVDESLKEKVKCLVFIPIVSRTYCDPKSFAWDKEFLPFLEFAKNDVHGLKVKVTNGNVASRVLPVRIHDLDSVDVKLFEEATGGVMRSVDFVYKGTGVNRPLREKDDDQLYLDQVNKLANSIREIINSMKHSGNPEIHPRSSNNTNSLEGKTSASSVSLKKVLVSVLIMALISLGIYFFLLGKNSFITSEINESITKSIAVMPFEDLSPDNDQEWFSDGLSEEVINSLYNISGLQVRGRNSSFAFKNKSLTIKQYADSLDVNYVVEGSVRKFENDLRVTVQLINAKDDIHLWSNQYDMKAGDVFLIQSEIANNIAKVLNIYLDEEERNKMINAGTKNTEAYEYFLKGKNLYHQWHETDAEVTLWDANKWFNKALAIDSSIALAYYYRADAFSHYYSDDIDAPSLGKLPKEVSWQEYLWNLSQSIRYEHNISTKLLFEIELKVMSDDWRGLDELGKKLSQDYHPSPFISTENIIAFVVMTAGPDLAIDILEKDILQDPQNLWLWRHYASILIYQGKLQAATIIVEKLRHMNDNNPYFSIVFLNELFNMASKQQLDSILILNSTVDVVSWAHNYWTGALHRNFERQADQIIQKEDSADHIDPIIINAFWQRGDDKMVKYLTQRLDETLTSGKRCAEFYLDLTFQFNYHLPFDINSAPKFRKKLIDAGIDPKLFKTLPQFTVLTE